MEATQLRPSLDRTLDFVASTGPARCRLRQFEEIRVAVVSEIDENPGMSVTNAAEAVAMAVEEELDVRFYGTSWRLVEHYPAGRYGSTLPATLALVTFDGYDRRGCLRSPQFHPLPGAMDWLPLALVD